MRYCFDMGIGIAAGLPKWKIVMEYPEGMATEHQAVFEEAARR